MGLARRLLEGAFNKMDELGERSQAASLAKLTPARARALRGRGRPAAPRRCAGRVGGGPRRRPPARQGPPRPGRRGRPRRHQAAEGPRGHRGPGGVGAARCSPSAPPATRARAAYLAPARHPVRITRVATRGKTQVREVADYLASSGLAARPDLVYGAYRVPDLISPARLGGEKGGDRRVGRRARGRRRRCAPAEPPGACRSTPTRSWSPAALASRAPLDEDLALDVLARAGIGPERTLGDRARRHDRQGGGDDDAASRASTRPSAASTCSCPPEAPPPCRRRRGRPWRIARRAAGRRPLDVLQWDAIAQAVHPVRQRRAPLPSPFAVPPAHPAGAPARVPRDRRRRPGGCLLRAGHPRPPVRPDGPHEHELERAAHRRRPRAAVRRRQARASGWPAATTSSSPTATRPSTPRAGRASTPTRRPSCRRTCAAASGCARRFRSPRAA